jgi:GNAT superfamily N-acetyltransferase
MANPRPHERPAETPSVRKARRGEAAELTELAMRSKAHWGYDATFLEAVRPILTFTEEDLERRPVFVLEAGRRAVGVYRLIGSPPEGELYDLWLEPRYIGRGFGRQLFVHALRIAAQCGFKTLVIESDPHAEGFYLAMGALRIGARRSATERDLPTLRIATEGGG